MFDCSALKVAMAALASGFTGIHEIPRLQLVIWKPPDIKPTAAVFNLSVDVIRKRLRDEYR